MEKYVHDAWSGAPDCPRSLKAPMTAEENRTRTFAELDRNNIVLAVLSGEPADVESWRKQRPGLFIPGIHIGRTGAQNLPPLAELRRLHAAGQLKVLGEVAAQNGGMAPNDPALEPYFALAEELDIPVAFHMGPHAPGTAYFASLGFRASNGDPLLFEEVLVRHPKLRIYLCHMAWPLSDNLVALMHAHPQVYVDSSGIDHIVPRAEFHHYLQRLMDAGFGKRIMFGSDQMLWPEVISNAVESIESSDFLTADQRRDIFYNNAVRFFRLSAAPPGKH